MTMGLARPHLLVEPAFKRARLESHENLKIHFQVKTVSDGIKLAVEHVTQDGLTRSAQR